MRTPPADAGCDASGRLYALAAGAVYAVDPDGRVRRVCRLSSPNRPHPCPRPNRRRRGP